MFQKKAEKLRAIRKCVVNGCDSNTYKNPHLIYHKFSVPNKRLVIINNSPQKFDKLRAWKTILKMKKTSNSMSVCSLHFIKEDYYYPGKCEFEGYVYI